MITFFRYVDDELDRTKESFGQRLERGAEIAFAAQVLRVEAEYPGEFEDEVAGLARPDGVEAYGVLIDMRLDQAALVHPDNKAPQPRRRYTGASLAQEIRSRESMPPDGQRADQWAFPVVLLAFSVPFRLTYRDDPTTQDLFDLAVEKGTIANGDAAVTVGAQLVALSRGYSSLRARRNSLGDVVGKLPAVVSLPPSLESQLVKPAAPLHVIAQTLLAELLNPPGMLVDESLLFARLGVDARASNAEAVEALKRDLSGCEYTGVFREGWPRWWWPAVEAWLRQEVHVQRSFRLIPAVDRVSLLASRIGNGLVPATPKSPDHGTRFWAVCTFTGIPLDLEDSVRSVGAVPRPWTEYRYVDVEYAVSMLPDEELLAEDLPKVRAIRASEEEGDDKW